MGRETTDKILGTDRKWTGWRLEVTSYGEYVELSFADVFLRRHSDIAPWAEELTLALSHLDHPVDMLLGLRGLNIGVHCGEVCTHLLSELFDRHAASLAYYGATPSTLDALGDYLRSRTDQSERIRSRSPALAQLMQNRRRRLGLMPMSHLSRDFLAGDNGWDESGAAFI